MDDRVSQTVSNTLDVDHDHVASGDLPREVAQSLSDKSLVGVRFVHPASVVVLLDVVSLDVVLSVPVFDIWVRETFLRLESILIGLTLNHLVDERSYEISQDVRLGDTIDNSLVELVHNEVADGYKLKVLAHSLDVMLIKVDLLHALENNILREPVIEALEGVSISSLTEWVLGNLDLGLHGRALDDRVLPVDHLCLLILHNEEIVSVDSEFGIEVGGVLCFHLLFGFRSHLSVDVVDILVLFSLLEVKHSLLSLELTNFISEVSVSLRKLSGSLSG